MYSKALFGTVIILLRECALTRMTCSFVKLTGNDISILKELPLGSLFSTNGQFKLILME